MTTKKLISASAYHSLHEKGAKNFYSLFLLIYLAKMRRDEEGLIRP